MLDKIKFWKKDDLGDNLALPPIEPIGGPIAEGFSSSNLGAPNLLSEHSQPGGGFNPESHPYSQPLGSALRPQYNQQDPFNNNSGNKLPAADNLVAKEMEIINSKLDYLKVSLENINQRLANLENMARQETQQKNNW